MALPIKEKLADDGNDRVVKLMREGLAYAEQGKSQFGLYLLCDPDDQGRPGNHFEIGWQGGGGYDFTVLAALLHFQQLILSGAMKRELPPSFATMERDASYVVHNLAKGAIGSFDFTAWLVDAWMTMIKEGAPPPLKVAFVHPTRPNFALDEIHAIHMFEHVAKPMLRLIGAVEVNEVSNRMKEHALYKDVCAMARQGVEVPKFRASGQHLQSMRGYAGCVTITLREADHWPHRNSNLEEWLKFAWWLKDHGERVVFVRDTKYANAPLDTWETCPSASADLELRMALYQQAKCNAFVSNGPWNLALFSDVPWMMFVTVSISQEFDARDTFTSSHAGWWQTYHGVKEGGQFPWSGPRQRIVWENDTYARMKATWRDFFDSAERADIPSAASMLDGKGTKTGGSFLSAEQSI